MGTLEFIASLIGSLAWPVTLCTFLIVLRRPILNAFRDRAISKISVAGSSLEFDQQAKEVASLVTASDASGEQLANVRKLVPANIGKIVSAWIELEIIIRERLQSIGVPIDRLRPSATIAMASEHGLITMEQRDSLRGLLALRNIAVHSPEAEITDTRVEEFLVLADAIKTVLQMTKPSST